MSSRPKGRRSKTDPTYPGLWSDWIWHEQYKRYYKSRLTGPRPEDIEYEYQQPANTPRTTEETTLGPATEGYSQGPDQNYTHEQTRQTGTSRSSGTSRTSRAAASSAATGSADVDSVTDSFAQASISPSGGPYATPATYGTAPYVASTGYQASAPSVFSNVGSTAYAGGSHSGQPYVSPSTGYQNHIRTRDPYTDREEFDPHYKVHGGWQFKWGRIFKVLWAEPRSATGGGSSEPSGTGSVTVRKVAGGKEAYAKVRRFVIIKAMEGHCICLPILTYSGQGLNKRGVHAEHHAIIYSGKKPVAFRGEKEKGLQMRSIKVTPDNPRHKLDDASRLNYAKTYTVEYNVKVWFIGKVSSDSEWQIRTDYNRVHPPLEIRGVQPPDTPGDTYEYADGGTASSYPGYTAPYAAQYSSAGYTASYTATQSASSMHNPYGNPAEGAYAPSTGSSRSSHFPASQGYQHSTDPHSAGYDTGGYDSSAMPPGGYASGGNQGSAASGFERPLDDLEEVEEEQHQRRGHSRGPPRGSEHQGENEDLYEG